MPDQKLPQAAQGTMELPGFGVIESDRLLAQDDLFAVIPDKYPVAPGHTLIIPRRLLQYFRELTAAEKVVIVVVVAAGLFPRLLLDDGDRAFPAGLPLLCEPGT
jgi:hypothetical protein